MSKRWWLFAVFLCAWATGCKTELGAPGIADDPGAGPVACVDRDGDGYGFGCALGMDCDDTNAAVTSQCYVCAHDQPGCPCTTEGARTGCGKVTARVGDQTTCGYGSAVCAGGKWGECVLDGTTRSFTSSRGGLGLAPPTACAGNVCDPYCKQYPDTPDETLTRPGIIGTDAGLTLDKVDGSSGGVMPNGPMPDRIKTQLVDAGLYPDAAPDAIIYHELPPAATAENDVNGTATIRSADVYFMNYTTGDGSAAASNLWFSMDAPGYVLDRVRASIADSWFGYGRYEQYDRFGWNATGHPTIAYQHVQSMTRDPSKISTAVDWIDGQFWDTGIVAPTSWIDALFASSTTAGLRGPAGGYWVFPRDMWASPVSGESGPCPLGYFGYPCFRPWAVPITVLFTQSPADNGPGGQYAYSHGAYSIYGSSAWPAATAVTGNYTEATARALDPIGQFARYSGSTAGAMSNQSWHWAAYDTCPNGRGSMAPNVFFKFHASERAWYHFDTIGSTFDTALYIYTAAGQPVACNDHHFFSANPTSIPASIDGIVEAGDYFLVLDGVNGASGNYFLQVNAMPDGAALADPNYDEAVAAFNATGGKIVTVDTSGYTCDHGPTAFVQRNTGNQLDKLASDTGSVNGSGAPFQVRLDPSAGVCHAGDAALEAQLAGAIVGAYNSVVTARMDLTAAAFDLDDAIDFDGPPGGANNLTPVNIDDATFVQSVVTVPSAETNANCMQTMPDRFVGCTPGTKFTFHVTFRTPAAVPMLDHEQIFGFVIRTLRNGKLVLSETPVVIVVPPAVPTEYADGWFIRDYDTATACPKGTAPLWGFFSWDARTPGDSHIDFEVAVAPSVAELPMATTFPLLFSDPPGPSSLVLQPIGARAGMPDTRFGGTLVDTTLVGAELPRDSKTMRLRAHLVPSSDRLQAPVLQLWNQQISCQPAE
jgi:hypothetical protein